MKTKRVKLCKRYAKLIFLMKVINTPSKQDLQIKQLFSSGARLTPVLGCICAVLHVVFLAKLHNTVFFQGSA